MTDILDSDSYLLKCTLESIEEGVKAEDIQAKCKCQMGFVNCDSEYEDSTINSNKGEK